MKRSLIIWMFVLSLLCSSAYGQDVHFSHFHASPTFLNPAMSGVHNAAWRFSSIYRNQWTGTTGNFNTIYASADGKLIANRKGSFLGLGINAFADRAGDLDFSTYSGSLSLSYSLNLSRYKSNFVSLGIQSGFLHQSADLSELHVFDQEDLFQQASLSSRFVPDIALGFSWFYDFGDHFLYAGAAIYHLNRPNLSLGSEPIRLYPKEVIHAGAEINLNDHTSLLPGVTVFMQGPHREIMCGSFYRYDLEQQQGFKSLRSAILFGTWLRWYYRVGFDGGFDALVASVRWDKGPVQLMFSYDVNLSSLKRSSRGNGGPELSVVYLLPAKWNGQKTHKINCPAF